MAIRIVQLGSARLRGEGVRLGTVRRPPRGVPRTRFASENWFDVWLPNLAPSQELMSAGRSSTSLKSWKSFARRYEAEMNRPDASRVLDALAALSHSANFSVGCYCEDETHCHRSLLRELLARRGAKLA
ncbi:MAG: DUF488 family protein [Thermoanaerobaculia bacterium]|nr:DUF488 family protein [Thermoanaerobaculia bacterium]